MKRLLTWCLVGLGILGVLVVIALTAGYLLLYRPYIAPLGYVASGARLEERLTNRSRYVPPAGGRVSEEQVTRFVHVEERIEAVVGSRIEFVRTGYDELLRAAADGARGPTRREAHRALGAIGPVFMRAKSAQIDALNEMGFSKAEYQWVRSQVYAEAGLTLSRLDLEAILSPDDQRFEQIISVRTTRPDDIVRQPDAQLVERYLPKLKEWLALAFFDL